jgi:hypothetical protein
MKTNYSRIPVLVLGACLMMGSGPCHRVQEGPVNPHGGGGPAIIRATEPEPEEIPQKEVPAGQSSLRKTGPDRPLYP